MAMFNYEQSYAFLKSVVNDLTGINSTISATPTQTFTSLATTANGYSESSIIKSIGNILNRTIFSSRAYDSDIMDLLTVDRQEYGAITRKLTPIRFEGDTNNEEYTDSTGNYGENTERMQNGLAVDMYKIHKAQMLETKMYGGYTYQFHITRFQNQIKSALANEGEWNAFLNAVMTEVMNEIKQSKEADTMFTISEIANAGKKIYLRDVYTTETGKTYDSSNLDNYEDYCRFVIGYIATLTELMSKRSGQFNQSLGGKILKFTPAKELKAIFISRFLNQVKSRVESVTFNADKLKMIQTRTIPYWANPNEPYTTFETYGVTVNDSAMTITKSNTKADTQNVVGIIFDKNAGGVTWIDETVSTTPLNSAGLYYNTYFHFTRRNWLDVTEQIVTLIDASASSS